MLDAVNENSALCVPSIYGLSKCLMSTDLSERGEGIPKKASLVIESSGVKNPVIDRYAGQSVFQSQDKN